MKERRKYTRYDTEAKIYFCAKYDIKTKIKFKILDDEGILARKNAAVSRNVSAEGISFSSNRKLKKGEILYLEIYLPSQKIPVTMTGKVKWSHLSSGKPKGSYKFDTGIKLLMVEDKIVSKTIYFDKKHSVYWSVILEYVFGSFSKLVKNKRRKKK
jgi:hypothetical protein